MADENKFYTYILECSDGTYYTGKTSDLKKRLRQHNGEIAGGAKYTKIRRPVTLRYFEEHKLHIDACRREAKIKTFSKAQKADLCK